MAKLLIAVKSEVLAAALAEELTGHSVCVCHTGKQALATLETQQPEILILDLSLPWVSGLTVLQETRYKPPVILALTNILGDAVIQAAANAGAQDILLLPCSVERILRRLDALV